MVRGMGACRDEPKCAPGSKRVWTSSSGGRCLTRTAVQRRPVGPVPTGRGEWHCRLSGGRCGKRGCKSSLPRAMSWLECRQPPPLVQPWDGMPPSCSLCDPDTSTPRSGPFRHRPQDALPRGWRWTRAARWQPPTNGCGPGAGRHTAGPATDGAGLRLESQFGRFKLRASLPRGLKTPDLELRVSDGARHGLRWDPQKPQHREKPMPRPKPDQRK